MKTLTPVIGAEPDAMKSSTVSVSPTDPVKSVSPVVASRTLSVASPGFAACTLEINPIPSDATKADT